MGKNNALINTYKRLDRKIQELTPNIYASFALALCRRWGWDHEMIADLFDEVGAIWSNGVNTPHNLIQECEDETGIVIQIEVFGKGE